LIKKWLVLVVVGLVSAYSTYSSKVVSKVTASLSVISIVLVEAVITLYCLFKYTMSLIPVVGKLQLPVALPIDKIVPAGTECSN
jgi:hypothetical protein